MKKKAEELIPPVELEIMNVLWDHGPANVQEVQIRLSGKPAYTTVQTTLNTMEKKGRTKRTLNGRAYVYKAAIARDAARKRALSDLVDRMFSGSVENLMMSLLKNERVDNETFARLRKLVTESEQA